MSQFVLFPLIIIFYAAISTIGLYLLKATENVQSINFAIGVIFYGSGAVIWLLILRSFPLSVAFPVAAGTLIITTQIAGILYLDEKINFISLVGSGFIITGIIIMYTTMAKSNG